MYLRILLVGNSLISGRGSQNGHNGHIGVTWVYMDLSILLRTLTGFFYQISTRSVKANIPKESLRNVLSPSPRGLSCDNEFDKISSSVRVKLSSSGPFRGK